MADLAKFLIFISSHKSALQCPLAVQYFDSGWSMNKEDKLRFHFRGRLDSLEKISAVGSVENTHRRLESMEKT